MLENKGYRVDSIDQIILKDEEIVKKIKETTPQKLDESDAESRIKYIDKIETTINYIEDKINNNENLEEDRKKYLTKILEDKKQELNNCDFKRGTTEKKFKETFYDLCPELIDKIKEEKNKKDGLKDASTLAIDKSFMMNALYKIVQTKNEEHKRKEEQEKIILKSIETKQNNQENIDEPSLKALETKQPIEEADSKEIKAEQNKDEASIKEIKIEPIKKDTQESDSKVIKIEPTEPIRDESNYKEIILESTKPETNGMKLNKIEIEPTRHNSAGTGMKEITMESLNKTTKELKNMEDEYDK